MREEAARQLIAHHYRVERWYAGEDDLESRPAEMVKALLRARLEDPDLLSTPHLPLDELLDSLRTWSRGTSGTPSAGRRSTVSTGLTE